MFRKRMYVILPILLISSISFCSQPPIDSSNFEFAKNDRPRSASTTAALIVGAATIIMAKQLAPKDDETPTGGFVTGFINTLLTELLKKVTSTLFNT